MNLKIAKKKAALLTIKKSGRTQQALRKRAESLLVHKTKLADHAHSVRSFVQINELFHNTGRLAVGVHEERTGDRVGTVLDRLGAGSNTINKKRLHRAVNKTEAKETDGSRSG